MKRFTRAQTLISLLQLDYLCGSNRSSLFEERNSLSSVCFFIWCDLRISTFHFLRFDFVLWSLRRILLQEGWTTPTLIFVFFSLSEDTKPSCKQIRWVQFSRHVSPLFWVGRHLDFSNAISPRIQYAIQVRPCCQTRKLTYSCQCRAPVPRFPQV